MNLYFLDDQGEEELVRCDVKVENSREIALEHLKQRKPSAHIKMVQEWDDMYAYHWIDFGRSGGFYILHNPTK